MPDLSAPNSGSCLGIQNRSVPHNRYRRTSAGTADFSAPTARLGDGRIGSWSCKNAIPRRGGFRGTAVVQRRAGNCGCWTGEAQREPGAPSSTPRMYGNGGPILCPDRCDQQPASHDVHDAGEIVGEDVQRHLARDTRQRLHQEVRRPHAGLDRREGVLDRLAPLAHGLRVLVEPPLHGFEDMLMLPARDPALFGWRAMALDRTARAGGCPIAA